MDSLYKSGKSRLCGRPLLSHLERHKQHKTTNHQDNASKIGLKISVKKTEIISLNTKHPVKIQLNGNYLAKNTHLTYLGSIVTTDRGADKEIKTILGKARGAFNNLSNI